MVVTMGMIKYSGISPMFGHRESYIFLFIRGTAGAVSMALYYFAILLMPLADVVSSSLTEQLQAISAAKSGFMAFTHSVIPGRLTSYQAARCPASFMTLPRLHLSGCLETLEELEINQELPNLMLL